MHKPILALASTVKQMNPSPFLLFPVQPLWSGSLSFPPGLLRSLVHPWLPESALHRDPIETYVRVCHPYSAPCSGSVSLRVKAKGFYCDLGASCPAQPSHFSDAAAITSLQILCLSHVLFLSFSLSLSLPPSLSSLFFFFSSLVSLSLPPPAVLRIHPRTCAW